ncbi:MAG: Hsp20/alpha crystallin family protein [Candidatus Lokiarchaeota archaeon]|nr:Hsp20/alpha crystallin family protein [Candidatus Lokiarchaeota archaeon]
MHKTYEYGGGHRFYKGMDCGPRAFVHMDMGHIGRKVMRHIRDCMTNFEGWIPYNIEDHDNNYLITVPLPGFSKEDVKVSLISNNLNVKAERPSQESDKKEKDDKEDINCGFIFCHNLLNFLWNKDVNLDIPLPSDVDREKIISKMNNGLLKIKIEKLPPQKIDINTEDSLN